jgi:hypothetical protein
MELNKLLEISNNEYHSDNGFYSSSQLKDALGSPLLFHKKYILKDVDNKRKPHFDIGNAFHVKLLEPDKYNDEVAYFKGRRIGAKWEAFEKENTHKAILSDLHLNTVDTLVNSVAKHKLAMEFIQGGVAEMSIFGELEGVSTKCRADYLNVKDGYIMDLKSTTGELTPINLQKTIAKRHYDLSAAMYLDLFKNVAPDLKDFIFIFSSKDYPSCKVVKASPRMIENGRRKYKKALKNITKFKNKDWVFKEEILILDPMDDDLFPELLEEF